MFDAIIGIVVFGIIGSIIMNAANKSKEQQNQTKQRIDPREIFKDFLEQADIAPRQNTTWHNTTWQQGNTKPIDDSGYKPLEGGFANDPGMGYEFPADSHSVEGISIEGYSSGDHSMEGYTIENYSMEGYTISSAKAQPDPIYAAESTGINNISDNTSDLSQSRDARDESTRDKGYTLSFSRESLINGIIMAEILQPPKARRMR